MQSEPPFTSGVSSRRSACDLCRSQKLRCLRESTDPDDRCDRCTKADVQCITSPIFRMRNYSTKDDRELGSRKRQRQQQHTGQPSTPAVSTPIDWLPEDVLARQTYSATSTSFISPNDSTLGNSLTPSSSTWENRDIPGLHGHEKNPEPSTLENLISDLTNPKSDAIGGTHGYMEELSKINLSLVSQLKQMSQGPPYVTLKTLIDPVCGNSSSSLGITPLEDILNSTQHYLDVLSLIPKISQSSPKHTLNVPAGEINISERTPMSHEYNTPSSDFSQQLNNMIEIPTQLDNSVFLLFLTCYIHTLRLHVALFWHIKQYLQVISESEIVPYTRCRASMGLTASLSSGNLQAMVIIQLVTNMFERMETVLGLPREFRIGTREDNANGLIQNAELVEIVRTILRKEDEGRPEEGKGGIKSLREDMKKATRLLRDHIAP